MPEQPELIATKPSFLPCELCKRSDGTCQWRWMSCFDTELDGVEFEMQPHLAALFERKQQQRKAE